MAKKGQAVQLQLEINNDDEWDKFLQKSGLIVVDIYSEWCGPCLGMQANLKKIKLELGGDVLVLAVAKSDGITQLARFRNKSEPTWMFISKGKMVNLMFGADAPKLTRIITEELKKEQSAIKGEATDRVPMDITEMAEEERVRYDAAESIEREIREKEEAKRAKELLERRTKECENILNNVPNFGTVLIFPSAKDKYKEVLHDILDEAGLIIHQTEKLTLKEETLQELCYFANYDEEFPESCREELLNDESCLLLLKLSQHAIDQEEEIDDTIFAMIYGKMKRPPGDHECVAQLLVTVEEATDDQPRKERVGVWVPMKPQLRATALKLFFPKVTKEFLIPEPEPEPDHVAIIFPINKKDEILPVVHQYQQEVMKRGFFTSENPDDAQLVAKTLKELEKLDASHRTYSERMVMQVSKKRSEAILAFASLDPIYMSPNPKEGKMECAKFFPEGYEEVEEEDTDEEAQEEGKEEAEGEKEEDKQTEDSAVPNEEEQQPGEGGSVVESETTEEVPPEGDLLPSEAGAPESPPPPAPEEAQ
ncbi:hypothetical protein GWI33_014161 [Rhynchophorus ferrugineus]|uniref:Uncharacterized protein n=1 Tax=Rhynchophorus ferrugineus TaxID=354439 RepID=A0A834I7R6_RHYFE|nr:hypothetical protein GWI33_014161 [Rhynchophorus ferrugineus]